MKRKMGIIEIAGDETYDYLILYLQEKSYIGLGIWE